MACKTCGKGKSRLKKDEHKEVVKHLKGDIRGYKDEANEDRALIKKLGKKEKKAKTKAGKKRSDLKFDRVLKEYDQGKLHSGSKKGPKVKNPKQAVAIAYSESRRAYKKKNKKSK